MTKLYNRTMPLISRNSDNENSYLDEFQKNLNKISVQPYRHENVYEQINSIINGSKPKYSSVEDAVKDMQDRSGITAHQDKIKVLAEKIKTAACNHCAEDKNEVKLFKTHPQIKNTFDNFITDTKGNLPIPSIIDRVKSIHNKDVDDNSAWDDESLIRYINDKGTSVKKDNPDTNYNDFNLGHVPKYEERDIDKSNQDALFCLNPAVVK